MSTRNYVPRLIHVGRVNFSVKGHPKCLKVREGYSRGEDLSR